MIAFAVTEVCSWGRYQERAPVVSPALYVFVRSFQSTIQVEVVFVGYKFRSDAPLVLLQNRVVLGSSSRSCPTVIGLI